MILEVKMAKNWQILALIFHFYSDFVVFDNVFGQSRIAKAIINLDIVLGF